MGSGLLLCIAVAVALWFVGLLPLFQPSSSKDHSDSFIPTGSLAVYNNGPFALGSTENVTFSLVFSNDGNMSDLNTTRLHIGCCDGFEHEAIGGMLPDVFHHEFHFATAMIAVPL